MGGGTIGVVMVTVPLEGVSLTAVPVASDSMGLVTGITVEVFVVVGEIPRLTTPTVPLAIVLLFVPYTIQTMDPAEGLQIKDFPAAVAAGPALTEMEEISVVE